MRHIVMILTGLCAALTFLDAAQAQTQVEVWDARLKVTRGTLQGVSESMVTYFDENRAYQTLSRDSLVRVRVVPRQATTAPGTTRNNPTDASAAGADGMVRVQMRDANGNVIVRLMPAPVWRAGGVRRVVPQPAAEPAKPKEVKLDGPGWLWLADGQKLKAVFKGSASGERMAFNSDRLGEFTVPVDKVLRFWPEALVEPLTPTEGQDTLLLANGDRLAGFLESLDDKGMKFKVQGAENAVDLAPAQVAGFWLTNPPAPASPGMALVTLGSGEVLGAAGLKASEEKLTLSITLVRRVAGAENGGGEAVELSLGDVQTIDFFGPAGRLVPLKDIPRQITGGGDFLGMPNTIQENAQGMILQAPITVRYALPAGSSRLMFTAAAWCPTESQELSRKWTRFDAGLVMAGQKSPAWQAQFVFGKQERAVLETQPGPMDLTLGEQNNGPVLDKLLLSDAFVLVKAAN